MGGGSPTCPLCNEDLINHNGNRMSLPDHIRKRCPNGPNGESAEEEGEVLPEP